MMDNKINITFISQNDLIKSGCFNIPEVIDVVENAFLERAKDNVIFPDKVSVIFDEESQNRINCLPAGSKEKLVYGMKWVSVFPENPQKKNIQNVTAVILLSDMHTGFPLAFMEGTLCSNLRTAATSAVAAKYLAKEDSSVIGFIGAGEQAKSHLMTLLHVRKNIKTCKVASRTHESELKFISQMSLLYPDVHFIDCKSSYKQAAEDSDIIVTAISSQEMILRAEWIKPGALYCHVGGLEDEYAVPLKATKIVCDDWNVVKHRTQTISRMYKENLLKDSDIYCNLHQIVNKEFIGRESNDEFIYFNTVGMSYVDVLLANYMYEKVMSSQGGVLLELQDKEMFAIDPQYIVL